MIPKGFVSRYKIMPDNHIGCHGLGFTEMEQLELLPPNGFKKYGNLYMNNWSADMFTPIGSLKAIYIAPLRFGMDKPTGWLVFLTNNIVAEDTPLFDITICATDEYGRLFQMGLLGVKLKGKGLAGKKINFEYDKINIWEMIKDIEQPNPELDREIKDAGYIRKDE